MPLYKMRPSSRKSLSGSSVPDDQSPTYHPSSTTDKSSHAAQMAQQLASESSWADRYVPSNSAVIMTPPESVADTQSQAGMSELPPSYEDVRRERELPPIPQNGTQNVRQDIPSHLEPFPAFEDLEFGPSAGLLYQRQDATLAAKRRKRRRFIITFVMLAFWLVVFFSMQLLGEFWQPDGMSIPPPPQRKYTRHETNAAITGTFSFYDGLELSTTNASINIVIDPQPSDKVGTINLASQNGSIKVRFSDEYMKSITLSGMLSRVCDIEIKTKNSSQQVDLPIGNGDKISLTSDNGSINAKLLMAQRGTSTNITTLTTETTTGSQNIKIKSTSPDPFASLAGKIHAKSHGSIKLALPTSWEGMVHATSSGQGSVDVKGDGLQYQRYGDKETYAWRVREDDKPKSKLKRNTDGQVIELVGEGNGSIKVDCSSS